MDLLSGELTYFLRTIVAVFVIVDPFAVVPVYLLFTERNTPVERRNIRRKASLVALGILLVFAISGMAVFRMFGITLPAFQIAGGILLLLLGIAQLNSKRDRVRAEEREEGIQKDDVSVFPLGTPLLAGPGAISTVVLMSTEASAAPMRKLELLLAILIALVMCHVVLKGAPMLLRVLGRTGLNLLTRIMGIILTAVAVQFILNGLTSVVQMLKAA